MMPWERDQKTGDSQFPAEVSLDQPAAGRLHVVDEAREVEVWRKRRQDVAWSVSPLNPTSSPSQSSQLLADDLPQAVKHRSGDALLGIGIWSGKPGGNGVHQRSEKACMLTFLAMAPKWNTWGTKSTGV
jgi:hypothetical protein